MGIGEREVTADGTDVPDPHVGHVPGDRADQRAASSNERGPLDRPMRDRGADREPRAIGDIAEPADALDVDEVSWPEQAELHQEQELGPARVRRRVFAEPGQERASLFGGLGPMKRERSEHGQRPNAAAGRTISSAIIRRYSMRAFTSRGRL